VAQAWQPDQSTGPQTDRVGCALGLLVETPAVIALQVAAARRVGVRVREQLDVVNNGRPLPVQEILGDDHGRQHLIRVEPGPLTINYNGEITRTGPPAPEAVTEAQQILAQRPSRYCPSDRMAGFAQSHFGELGGRLDQIRAITAYAWRHIGYEANTSGPTSDAVETLLSGRGVCRDFAHLVVTLCRAIDIPARVAAVYAPGLSPMDFHAVAETAIDGTWWTWDATRLAPRPTLIRIATGRDAADTAFATVLSGRAELSTVEIFAVAAGDLPLDDHEELVRLA
jgi:transglutaminase-like putative cysteine protease